MSHCVVWPVASGVPKDCTTFRNALFWVTTQRVVVISYRRFGTYQSPLHGGEIHKGETLDKRFTTFSSNTKQQEPQLIETVCITSFINEAFIIYYNIYTYYKKHYVIYTIIYISIKAILNGRLKELIFLYYIIYKQFGHAPSSFASHPLDCWTLRNNVL